MRHTRVGRPRSLVRAAIVTAGVATLLAVALGSCATAPEPAGLLAAGPPEEPSGPEEAEPPEVSSPEESPAAERRVEPPRPRDLAAELPADRRAVTSAAGRAPISIEVDLTGDGVAEICLFTVSGGDDAASLEVLSDISRTVNEEELEARFAVAVFEVAGGRTTLLEEIEAGTSAVLRDVGLRRLNQDGALPVAFYFDFADAAGQKLVWIVHGGGERVSRMVLRKDALFGSEVEDIDDDGVLDIVRSERHMEDGTGYETFVTWLRWNGRGYEEYRTTNIVRNLNGFLTRAARRLGSGDFRGFAEIALSQRVLERLEREGVSPLGMVDRMLSPATASINSFSELTAPSGGVDARSGIEGAEFPRFFENPFPSPGGTVTVPVRVVCCGGLSAVFETTVAMAENPFDAPQYYFVPADR